MIKEMARVVEIGESGVWIEPQRESACGGCTANKVCSVNALQKVMGKKRTRLKLITDQPVTVGQLVLVGLEEHALARGAIAVYGLPMAGLLLGALLGGALDAGEVATTLLGMAGLGAGLLGLRQFSNKVAEDTDYQPQLLRAF